MKKTLKYSFILILSFLLGMVFMSYLLSLSINYYIEEARYRLIVEHDKLAQQAFVGGDLDRTVNHLNGLVFLLRSDNHEPLAILKKELKSELFLVVPVFGAVLNYMYDDMKEDSLKSREELTRIQLGVSYELLGRIKEADKEYSSIVTLSGSDIEKLKSHYFERFIEESRGKSQE